MMSLLVPLGLLGLLSIAVLLLIYIIKPNYQIKHISSSYVWKLSLKYKRRRIQTSTFRRILLLLCQILILAIIALIFTRPVWQSEFRNSASDAIAVIDSSASMYTKSDGETRFNRALRQVMELIDETAAKNGNMTVILADGTPDYIVAPQVSPRDAAGLVSVLQEMQETQDACSYGTSDMEAAIDLCEDVLETSPQAKIYLYTDKKYANLNNPEQIEVCSVTKEGEWNVGILDATAAIEEGYYTLSVDVATFGSADIPVDLYVQVVLPDGGSQNFEKRVYCENAVKKTVIFRYGGGTESGNLTYYDLTDEEKFSSFISIDISLGNPEDSFDEDNTFHLYGGQKEIVRIQYVSTQVNPFFPIALGILRNIYGDRWDIRVTEVAEGGTYETSGYDFYIFEHTAPAVLPRDGVILFSDPDAAPAGVGFDVLNKQTFNGQGLSLTAGSDHPVIKGIDPDNILLWEICEIAFENTLYTPLLYCNTMPVLLCSNKNDSKVAVMGFSLNRSNIVREYDFMLLISNLFGYYFPSTVEKFTYEVGEEITVNARGPKVVVKEKNIELTQFPATLPAGTFASRQSVTLLQDSYYSQKKYPDLKIFIRLPAEESNIWQTEAELSDPYAEIKQEAETENLIIWFAAALAALLFAEWLLQARDQ